MNEEALSKDKKHLTRSEKREIRKTRIRYYLF